MLFHFRENLNKINHSYLVDYWIIMLEVFFFLVEKRMQLVCTTFSTESWRPEAVERPEDLRRNYGRRGEAAAAAAAADAAIIASSAYCRRCGQRQAALV